MAAARQLPDTAGTHFFTVTSKGARLLVVARGDWTAENAAGIEADLDTLKLPSGPGASLKFELGGMSQLDTFGVWLLESTRRRLVEAGIPVTFSGVSDSAAPMLSEIRNVLKPGVEKPMGKGPGQLELLVNAANRALNDVSDFTRLLGATFVALAQSLFSPRQFRITSTINQFDRVGWRALPIVLLVTMIIGAIIAQQGFFHFSEFGADLYVIDMIGFLIMREIGVLLVAIMVAGRSGSAFTAELGSMKMREEIDALRTMGLNPVAVLVLPRTLAVIFALPALTFLGSMSALAGAGFVAVFYAGLSPDLFIDRLREAISLEHLQVGLIKAPFIGLVIGTIACMEGLRVAGSTASLGEHTTLSVVKSIFMVIVLDGLFAVFFSGIGM